MRFVTCRFEGRTTWGAVTEDQSGVIDLGRRFPDLPDLSAALETGRLTEAQEAAGWSDADFDGRCDAGDIDQTCCETNSPTRSAASDPAPTEACTEPTSPLTITVI